MNGASFKDYDVKTRLVTPTIDFPHTFLLGVCTTTSTLGKLVSTFYCFDKNNLLSCKLRS